MPLRWFQKKFTFFFFSFSFLLFAKHIPAHDTFEEIHVKLSYNPSQKKLFVSFLCTGNFQGHTAFDFPDSWASSSSYSKTVKEIQLNGEQFFPSLPSSSHTFQHPPSKTLCVAYTIEPDTSCVETNIYDALQNEDVFQAPGHAIFAHPDIKQEFVPKIFMTFEAENEWVFYHPHSLEKDGLFTGNISSIAHSLYLVRKQRTLHETPEARVSFQGNFSDSLQTQYAALISRIRRSYQEFFTSQDPSASHSPLLISLLESPRSGTTHGTYLSNSFISLLPPLALLHGSEEQDMVILHIAHELFHEWAGQRMKLKKEQEDYWWSEGFTDYYSLVLPFRSGTLSFVSFRTTLNQRLHTYSSSPVKHASNHTIKEHFWDDDQVQNLPYSRGFVFALYLNGKIKNFTQNRHSLDDLMKDLYSHIQREGCHFSGDLLHSLSQKYIPGGIEKDLEAYITQGKEIPFAQELQVSLPFETKTFSENGFTWKDFLEGSTTRVRILSVTPQSPAFEANLQPGDILAGWEWPSRERPTFCLTKEDGAILEFLPHANQAEHTLSSQKDDEVKIMEYFKK